MFGVNFKVLIRPDRRSLFSLRHSIVIKNIKLKLLWCTYSVKKTHWNCKILVQNTNVHIVLECTKFLFFSKKLGIRTILVRLLTIQKQNIRNFLLLSEWYYYPYRSAQSQIEARKLFWVNFSDSFKIGFDPKMPPKKHHKISN